MFRFGLIHIFTHPIITIFYIYNLLVKEKGVSKHHTGDNLK